MKNTILLFRKSSFLFRVPVLGLFTAFWSFFCFSMFFSKPLSASINISSNISRDTSVSEHTFTSYKDIRSQETIQKRETQAKVQTGVYAWCENKKSRLYNIIRYYRHLIYKKLISTSYIKQGVQLGVVACGAYLLYKNRMEIGVIVRGGEYFLSERVRIGNSDCSGREVALTDRVFLQQVAGPNQQGHSCAYHALRACLIEVEGVVNSRADISRRLNDSENVNVLIGNEQAPWRQLIRNGLLIPNQLDVVRGELVLGVVQGGRPLSVQNTDNLHEEEITNILRQGHNGLLGLAADFDGTRHITVVQSVDYLRNFCGMFGPTESRLNEVQRRLEEARGMHGHAPHEYVHGFVLGTMEEIDSRIIGHWIAVVLHHDGIATRYTVTNSLSNMPIMQSAPVRALITRLEGPDIAARIPEHYFG